MNSPYKHTVASGETLGLIGKRYKKSVSELVEVNHLVNADQLKMGQVIYLDKYHANAVQVMFMDKLRYPIEGLKTMLKFDGQTFEFLTDARGLLPLISTENITSKVKVLVENARQEWKLVGETFSGLGLQWMNLISPGIKFKQPLLPHDEQAAQPPLKPANSKNNPHDGKADGEPISKGHPVKKKTGQSHNTVVLSVDVPQDLMAYFKLYEGGDLTEREWEGAAVQLSCEAEVLQAIAKVESGGRSAYWRLNKENGLYIPAILFERHYFSRLSKRKYDQQDPDISWPTGYRKKSTLGEDDKKMSDGRIDADDIYGDRASAYLRLIKAYRLDKKAALQSASWGKFQIMGANHASCGEDDPFAFVKKMCMGEAGQLELLTGFIDSNSKLKKAVQTKDWVGIARNYNGPDYKIYIYETKLAEAYKFYITNKGNA